MATLSISWLATSRGEFIITSFRYRLTMAKSIPSPGVQRLSSSSVESARDTASKHEELKNPDFVWGRELFDGITRVDTVQACRWSSCTRSDPAPPVSDLRI